MDEASVNDAAWLERLAAGTNYAAGEDVVEVAKEALALAAAKLPVKTRFIERIAE